MAKMGAYIIIMPDRVWYNTDDTSCGYMENKNVLDGATVDIKFSLADANGAVITYHDAAYYEKNEAKDGDYLMTTTSAGKPSLKVYSATTGIWLTVATTYVLINGEGIGKGFEKSDGIKITSDSNQGLENILLNKETLDDGTEVWTTNTYIKDKTDNSITIPGIFSANSSKPVALKLTIERKVPDMA